MQMEEYRENRHWLILTTHNSIQIESAEEVKAFIEEKFAVVVASKNKGMIMKNVMPELKGKADGKVINEVVGELCK